MSESDPTRRKLLTSTLAAGATALVGRKALAQHPPGHQHPASAPAPAPRPPTPAPAPGAKGARRLVVPNGSLLPWKQQGGVKIYHLVAQPIAHTIIPGPELEAWGYNGSSPAALIEAVEGDRVRLYV